MVQAKADKQTNYHHRHSLAWANLEPAMDFAALQVVPTVLASEMQTAVDSVVAASEVAFDSAFVVARSMSLVWCWQSHC